MEGMCGGNLSERPGHLCNRCGCMYSFLTDSCPECRDLTDKEAKIKKLKLYDSRIKNNKKLGFSFLAVSVILLLILVLAW